MRWGGHSAVSLWLPDSQTHVSYSETLSPQSCTAFTRLMRHASPLGTRHFTSLFIQI